MSTYSINSNNTSQTTPKLKRGSLRIYTSTSIFWVIGEDPVASSQKCALLRADESIEIRLPVDCSRLAVIAVNNPGLVTVTEINGKVKPSCSQ